jgi:hypothetical protein
MRKASCCQACHSNNRRAGVTTGAGNCDGLIWPASGIRKWYFTCELSSVLVCADAIKATLSSAFISTNAACLLRPEKNIGPRYALSDAGRFCHPKKQPSIDHEAKLAASRRLRSAEASLRDLPIVTRGYGGQMWEYA